MKLGSGELIKGCLEMSFQTCFRGTRDAETSSVSHIEGSAEKRGGVIEVATIQCAFCNGTGKDPFGLLSILATCQVCNGKGEVTVPENTRKCAFCGGTGVHRSRRIVCGGRGVVPGPPEGTKTEVCPDCRGTGRGHVYNVPCPKCGGERICS